MKNVNGTLVFKNSDVFINNLRCEILGNNIVMQGQAKNLLTMMNTQPGKAVIDWNISTPSLNLGAFTFLLKPGKKLASAKSRKAKLAAAASRIDAVLEEASLHVKLDVGKLNFRNFNATAVNADINLLEDRYILNNVGMKHSGGSLQLKGAIVRQKQNHLRANVIASLSNVDVSEVLHAFSNFGQDAITSKNLEGKLTADVDAVVGLDEKGEVLPSNVVSVVNFSLKNGALVNFEPIKKLQTIIFKKRDFEHIRFAELKNRLEINNGEIKINRMEIQSTALSFFVEGLYSMKGNTDLSIQVPLNNLKKRDADYNPENIGTGKKAGRSIFIRGRPGSDGNISFKVDLFNKYKKEKEGE